MKNAANDEYLIVSITNADAARRFRRAMHDSRGRVVMQMPGARLLVNAGRRGSVFRQIMPKEVRPFSGRRA